MLPDADFSHAQACLSTGRTYHYIDQKPESNHGHVLLCLHGFPDLWYGWRHQIHPWVAEGYRVIVPDMLGYGKTDMPSEASAYSTKHLCNDLAALLDHLEIQRAVVIGHDWGSFTAGRFALWYPERVIALALLSIPYTPPSVHHVPVHELAQRYPSYGYQVYFASEESTAEIESHLSWFFRLVFRARANRTKIAWLGVGELQKRLTDGTELPECMINDEEFEYYISNFQRGMLGPLSYYRTTKVRFEEERDASLPSNLRADLPVLTLYGTEDATCPPAALQNSKHFIDQLQIVPIPNVGHWIMIEAPQTVTEAILQWLRSTPGLGETVRL